jgi:hypothetical protein
MATKRKSPRSAFVPRVLVKTVIAGVVPACAVLACGGTQTAADAGNETGSGTDATEGDVFRGVAAVAYPAYEAGRDVGGSDGALDGSIDGTVDMDVFHGVAAVAYPAYEAGKG